METIYIETTVVGHLAGRLHPDPAIAARQQVTRKWWVDATTQHRLLISQIVLDECGAGDPTAARERLGIIESLSLLDITDVVRHLANELTAKGAIPLSEPRDALHIAIAAVSWGTIPGDVELQAHRERHAARSHRVGVSRWRIRASPDLHAR